LSLGLSQKFRAFANEILIVSDKKAKAKYAAVKSVSTLITSWAVSTSSESFPFVTLPQFEQVAQDALQQSEAELIAWLPIVSRNQQAAFEQYASDNQDWMVDGFRFEGVEFETDSDKSLEIRSWSAPNDTATSIDEPEYFVPLWQAGPVSLAVSLVLADFRRHPKLGFALEEVASTRHAILSDLVDLGFDSKEPRSIIFEPVFDKFGENEIDNSMQTVVGFVAAVIPWRVYFEDELPIGVSGINVSVNNTCGQEFTYRKYTLYSVRLVRASAKLTPFTGNAFPSS
jgi:CHASE domain